MVGLIEEKISVSKERQRVEQDVRGRVGVEFSPGMCPTVPSGDRRGQGQFQGGARVAAKLEIIRRVVPKGPRGRETGSGPEVSRHTDKVREEFT